MRNRSGWRWSCPETTPAETNTHQGRRLRHFRAPNQDLESLLASDSPQLPPCASDALQSHPLQPQKQGAAPTGPCSIPTGMMLTRSPRHRDLAAWDAPPLAPRGSFGDSPRAKRAGSQPGWGQVPPWGGSNPLVPLKRQIFAFEKPKRGRCQIFPIGHPRGAGHGAWGSLRRASHMETGSR